MSTENQDKVVSTHPTPATERRKVSIVTEPSHHAYDNPSFESPRSRKVSGTSEYVEIGPVRKKSILHNAHAVAQENISLSGCHHHHQEGTCIEIKKQS